MSPQAPSFPKADVEATAGSTLPPRSGGGRRYGSWLGPLIALVVVYAVFVALSPDTFARPANLVTMARQTAVVGIAASGMTLVIILGGIDLSVGSAVALTTVVVASLIRSGAGPWASALAGIAVGATTGVLNGTLIAGLRITPFIVTLGSMSILRGAAKGLAHEQKIDVDAHLLELLVAPLPPSLRFLVFPPAVWILVAVAFVTAIALRHTRAGRHVVAIGSNEECARLCGIDVRLVKVGVYTAAGALAGLAGLIQSVRLPSAIRPTRLALSWR